MRYLNLLLCIISPYVLFAQFQEEEVINISAFDGVFIRTGDIDFDGDQDVIAAMNSGLILYKNDGSGKMSTPKIVHKQITKVLDVSDINADGFLDIIGGRDNILFVYTNDGNGNFVTPDTIVNSGHYYNTLTVVDIDGDGDKDVLTSSNEDMLYWYENNGSGVFGVEHLVSNTNGNAPTSVYVYDLDNDGDFDVTYATDSYSDLFWVENLGGGDFGSAISLTSHITNAESVFVADLDNDGDGDILSASRGDNTIAWYRNDNGSFTDTLVISTQALLARSAVAIDVDGDNDLDVAFGGYEAGWHENLGNGIFGPENLLSSSTGYIRFAAVADLNNDSFEEFLTISSTNGPQVLYFPNNSGTFGAAKKIMSPAIEIHSFTSIDIENDGDNDIVTASFSDDKLALHKNLGNGVFSPQDTISTLSNGPETVVAADIDGDSFVDIIVASSIDNKIAWYKNNGSGFNSQQILSSSLTGIQNIDADDLDNDGDIDVFGAYENINTFIWFENLGGGVFSTIKFISAYNSVNGARQICAADIDGDGAKDVIGGSANLGIRWYKKNGASWTSNFVSSGIADELTDILSADMDGDGDNDIVSTSHDDGKLLWYSNQGSGVFSTVNIISSDLTSLMGADLSDLDLDGDIDIISVSSSIDPSPVCWFENYGNGQFAKRILTYSTLPENSYLPFVNVICSDFDNDGDEDVLTAEFANDKIALHKNSSLNPFQARGNFYIDVDQDGIRSNSEPEFPIADISCSPNSIFSNTFDNGRYAIDFDSTVIANYIIEPTNYNHWGITTDSILYNVSVNAGFTYVDSLDFGFFPIDLFDSLTPEVTGGFPRCNSIVNYWLTVSNNGTTNPSGILEFILDTTILFIGANINPDSIIGNHYYWSIDSLGWFADYGINLEVQMPDFLLMGDTLTSYLITSILDEFGFVTHTFNDTLNQILVCAYDPNDKTAEPMGFGPEGYILANVPYIDYTIRFQNTGNDTAQTVLIHDQIDANFVFSSLNVLASSHPLETISNIDGSVQFRFEQIFLPDSNTDEQASHGFVKYRIWLNDGLELGTTLTNFAEIFFDFNPAITTNTTHHTLFECASVNLEPMDSIICEWSDLEGIVLNPFPDEITWTIDSVLQIESNQLNWTADTSGVFNLQINRSNPYCSNDTTILVTILPNSEVIIDQTPLETICLENPELISLPNAIPVGGLYSGNGVQGNLFNPTLAGIGTHFIVYTLNNSSGCSNTDSISITVQSCAGNTEFDILKWIVFPNPSDGKFFISCTNKLSNYQFTISNAIGGLMFQQHVIDEGMFELDLSNYKSGVYFLHLIDGISGTRNVIPLVVE